MYYIKNQSILAIFMLTQPSSSKSAHRAKASLTAFTLIELLVVIAIIAILAAILFPVFGRARENARRSSCQSNLKQIGMASLQYSQDYDEFLPPAFIGNVTGPNLTNGAAVPIAWVNVIYPYIKSTQVFRCPSESEAEGTAHAVRYLRNDLGSTAASPNIQIPVHYAYNFYTGGGPSTAGWAVGTEFGFKKLPWITNPSRVILMADSGSIPPWRQSIAPVLPASAPPEDWKKKLSVDNTSSTTPKLNSTAWILVHGQSTLITDSAPTDTTNGTVYGTLNARHFDTTNVLWADGHVKATRPQQVMQLTATPNTYTEGPNTCFNPAIGCQG